MGRLLSYSATAQDSGLRLDTLLADKGFYASRSAAAKAIEEARVLVKGVVVPKKYQVAAGDFIVYEEGEVLDSSPIQGEPIPLDIRYEDDHLLVISKQPYLVCHPTQDIQDGTLVNALIYHCGKEHLCNVQGEDDRLGIVHRLDADTSGLMLCAKTNEAGEALMQAIREKTVERRYLALTHGVIHTNTGLIDAPLDRSPKNRLKRCVRESASAREAITTFQVLDRYSSTPKDDGYTLVDCKLFTGRTHQIRVHMEYTHHPLVGDPLYTSYSPKNTAASLGLSRQFLHSHTLSFTHPTTQEYLTFTDELPDDLQAVLDKIASRSESATDIIK